MQRVVAAVTDVTLDIAPYARRRELFCEVLTQAGYKFLKPQGAFYLFPKAPRGDDLGAVARLKEENILAVPGRGFGRAGYFRLAFCVSEKVIQGQAPACSARKKMMYGFAGEGRMRTDQARPLP
jgi:aspartate aminotransferase